MKLEISENIRRKRREREMSQEQLAEVLGVAPQTVSHWERGDTYPDMEMLPILAGFFSMTTDELLGVSGALSETRKKKYWDEFYSLPREDTEACVSVMRRALAEFPREWEFAYRLCVELPHDDNGRDEILRISYDALERCADGWWRALFTEFIAEYEDNDKVFAFLSRNTTDRDTRTNKLLELRYGRRGEKDLYKSLSQFNTARDVETVLFSDISDNEDPIRRIIANLDYINAISGIDEETRKAHPVLGDGVTDMWVDVRAYNGFCLACRLTEIGKFDEALDIIEEMTEVCARFLSLPDGSIMSYRTDKAGLLDVRVSTEENGWRRATFLNRVGLEEPGKPERIPMWPPDFGLNMLTQTGGEWHMCSLINPIREHQRYKACIERLKRIKR